MIQTGLENLLTNPPAFLDSARIGLLCNPASVDQNLTHTRVCLHRRFPGSIKALYTPQHGFFAEKQDNMVESGHTIDALLGIPVYSLYGETRYPDATMLEPIDTLIIDLQDVGTRVYTFIYTMAYCMQAARTNNIRVVVLDRPNPINGTAVEGNCLDPQYASFVGLYPLPMRHGLTIGELAQVFNTVFGIGCELKVIPMQGWQRTMFFKDTGLPWVAPSPNMPTPETALVYPGQVLWEGTNVSEGRGTTQPFEIIGSPFIDPFKIIGELKDIPGMILRPLGFEPCFNKWQGSLCRGFQLHVTHPQAFKPLQTSLQLIRAVLKYHPADFAWTTPPYEYEDHLQPIDMINGNSYIRLSLEKLIDINALSGPWEFEIQNFKDLCQPSLLY